MSPVQVGLLLVIVAHSCIARSALDTLWLQLSRVNERLTLDSSIGRNGIKPIGSIAGTPVYPRGYESVEADDIMLDDSNVPFMVPRSSRFSKMMERAANARCVYC